MLSTFDEEIHRVKKMEWKCGRTLYKVQFIVSELVAFYLPHPGYSVKYTPLPYFLVKEMPRHFIFY